MPREKHSFRSYSENVNILLTTESLVYPSVIHIKSEIFDYLLNNQKDLIIDCSYLKTIDFTGIRFFDELYKFQRRLGFNLVLSRISSSVLDIFKKIDVANEFVIFDANEDAADFLRKLSVK